MPGGAEPLKIVIVDASVLINMIHVDRLDLLGALNDFEFLVPEEVVEEISKLHHAEKLRVALEDGCLRAIRIVDLSEMQDYAELRQIMGKGEAACLALVHARGGWVACDERGRFLRHETQKQAEAAAKRYVANEGGGEVRIHGRDGKIRDSDTVPAGNDPNPPLDLKH